MVPDVMDIARIVERGTACVELATLIAINAPLVIENIARRFFTTQVRSYGRRSGSRKV